eukprot:5020179-Alexandrium_andersonii.AAC.1
MGQDVDEHMSFGDFLEAMNLDPQTESRLVEFVASRESQPTFVIDAEDADYRVPETEDVWVEMPQEAKDQAYERGYQGDL